MSAAVVLEKMLDVLWAQYVNRVPYAAIYQRMVEEKGGRVRNDHIAFRTFNCATGTQPRGVDAIARIFTALGYIRKDFYPFEDKHLSAWHWEHATDPRHPKIFISQLEVRELTPATAAAIQHSVADTRDLFMIPVIKGPIVELLQGKKMPHGEAEALGTHLAGFFTRSWGPPVRHVVEEVNKESQYAAWTLLHGNAVNHFTAYINEQKVKDWPDIEATVAALRSAGVPMKDEFEGEKGTKLRQSSTKAAEMECDVVDDNGVPGKMKWSYAYYELAERGDVPGPGGRMMRFQGFLGAQATNLFEMTKRS